MCVACVLLDSQCWHGFILMYKVVLHSMLMRERWLAGLLQALLHPSIQHLDVYLVHNQLVLDLHGDVQYYLVHHRWRDFALVENSRNKHKLHSSSRLSTEFHQRNIA
jgi:hypothetical protein